jgi:hypothetical protein
MGSKNRLDGRVSIRSPPVGFFTARATLGRSDGVCVAATSPRCYRIRDQALLDRR